MAIPEQDKLDEAVARIGALRWELVEHERDPARLLAVASVFVGAAIEIYRIMGGRELAAENLACIAMAEREGLLSDGVLPRVRH